MSPLPGGGVVNDFRNVSLKDLFVNESTTFYAPSGMDTPVSINLSGIAGMSDAAAEPTPPRLSGPVRLTSTARALTPTP